ncbi:MAG: MerR family transcriptional regulator [Flavisolibacter sp.]
MNEFSIKDLAELSGIKQHTIRIWEHRFNFLKPKRASNSQRTYTSEELNTLLDVALLNQNGYKISQIDKLALEEKLKIVSSMFQQQQKAINDLIIHMARMDAEGFESIIVKSFLSWGLDDTILHILLPFCEKVGLLEKSYTRKFQENIIIIREIIKQKIYVASEKIMATHSQMPLALIFLASDEPNELPVLGLQYLIKLSGFRTMYLGKEVNTRQLKMINQQTCPSYIITYLSKKQKNGELSNYVESLHATHREVTFISIENDLVIEGPMKQKYRFFSKISEVLDFMNSNKN